LEHRGVVDAGRPRVALRRDVFVMVFEVRVIDATDAAAVLSESAPSTEPKKVWSARCGIRTRMRFTVWTGSPGSGTGHMEKSDEMQSFELPASGRKIRAEASVQPTQSDARTPKSCLAYPFTCWRTEVH
jgi:hypothetical protein